MAMAMGGESEKREESEAHRQTDTQTERQTERQTEVWRERKEKGRLTRYRMKEDQKR
jgi:hypothetical protein